jgi:hypothetical protein
MRSICAAIDTNVFINSVEECVIDDTGNIIDHAIEIFGAEKEVPRLRLKRKRLLE